MSKRIPIMLGLVLMFVAAWLLITPTGAVRSFINRLENIGYDIQLRTRVLTHPAKMESPIVIVDIDDSSILKEGRWPWPRKKMAALVDELQKQGAAVLAFDIFFSESQSNIDEELTRELTKNNLLTPELSNVLQNSISLFDEDSFYAKSLATIPSILAISFLHRDLTVNALPEPILTISAENAKTLKILTGTGYISNIPVLQKSTKNGGFINIFPDEDGIMRRAPLIMEYRNGIYASLGFQAVLTFLGENIKLITPLYNDEEELEGIQVGSKIISTNASGQVLIPFIGRSYSFPYISATDILQKKLPADSLLGKIIFIGTSATGLGDLQATAIESPFPGVEIQASVAHGVLMNNFSYRPAWAYGANLFLIMFFGSIAAFAFPYLGPRTLAAIIILLPIGLILFNVELWARTGLVLSLLIPAALILCIAVLNILYGYLFETRKREQLKQMFGQYVPEKHIDAMIKSGTGYALHGEDRDMSVLFADIRGFTTISEKMTAKELVEMLNTFFTPMTEIIFHNKGTIDKYVGDLIMAFWSAPLPDEFHARNAIKSALEMQAKANDLRIKLKDQNWPDIHLGIGVNSGTMSVGDMGSRYRRNYTVLGDNVNLASRVEGLTKFYGADIVVTENTQKNQTEFVFLLLDKVRVKGKKAGVAIYDVLGKIDILTPELKQELDSYHEALAQYYAKNWDEALAVMETLHAKYPEKIIYDLYIKRIREFKETPPPADWDGVYVHLNK